MRRYIYDLKTEEFKLVEAYDDPKDDIALKKFGELLADYILSKENIEEYLTQVEG